MNPIVVIAIGATVLAWLSQGRTSGHPVAPWLRDLGAHLESRGWTRFAPAWAVPLVDAASTATGVPSSLLAALIRTESAYQPYVRSHAGAIGLGQLMPATAAALGVDPMNPGQNVLGAARYLREQLDRFGSVPLALAAYNAGPHRVVQYKGIPPYEETQKYVARIMSRLAG